MNKFVTLEPPPLTGRNFDTLKVTARSAATKNGKFEKNQTKTERTTPSFNNTNLLYKTINIDKSKLNLLKNNSMKTLTSDQTKRELSKTYRENTAKVNRRSSIAFASNNIHIDNFFLNIKKKQNEENFVLFDKKKMLKGKLQKLFNSSLLFTKNENWAKKVNIYIIKIFKIKKNSRKVNLHAAKVKKT